MRAAVVAEWVKVRSVRSTAWLPPTAAALLLVFGSDHRDLVGVYSGQIPVVVLAVLLVTAEYDTGLIVVTFTAVPRRLVVLAAKALVLVAVVLPAAVVGVALLEPAGTVLYLALVALFALGVGAALRHTAPALTTVLALLYLAPLVAWLVPDERIARYAPMTAGLTLSWRGFTVLGGYAAVALAVGAVRVSRDVRR